MMLLIAPDRYGDFANELHQMHRLRYRASGREQFLVSRRNHPVCPVEMAANCFSGTLRFGQRINAEDEPRHLILAGIVRRRIQKPHIDREVIPVIGRQVVRPGNFIGDFLFRIRLPHGRWYFEKTAIRNL
ncbi:hypothetical protein L598_002800000260 [Mesorhizobium sp. J18]|nr:hypothetical protein L598_002800000260 [Mesorhizobium sp. J18]